MHKSSIHLQPSSIKSLIHNCREVVPSYAIDAENKNEYSCTPEEAVATLYKLLSEAKKNYFDRTKQKIQTSDNRLVWEAVVNISAYHSLDDIKNLTEEFEKHFGWRVLHISIHKDEGHISKEDGKKVINYHVHILFFMLDSNGIYLMKKREFGKKKMAMIQTLTANILGMERGVPKIISGRERLNHWQYRKVMEMKNKFLLRIKKLTQTIEKAKVIIKQKNLKIKKLEKYLNATKEKAITISVENVKLKARIQLLQEKIDAVNIEKKVTIQSTLHLE